MDPLSSITEWPVEDVGAAAILPGGRVLAAGSTTRRFPLASVTKPLVAMAVLVAVEEGSLGLDDPAGPPGATARHLLAHASGLGPDGDEVLAPPATRRIYSNRGFEVLGELLEERTGLSAATYLDDAILAPLGATDTALEGSPAHGAVGTVEDLALLTAELLATEPRVLARSTRDLATTVAWPGLPGVLPGFGPQDANEWGLGFEIRGRKSPHWTPDDASEATFGHFGRSGSVLWVDPLAGAALVVLCSREFGDWAPPRWRALGDRVLAAAQGLEQAPAGSQIAPDRQQRPAPADVERAVDDQETAE